MVQKIDTLPASICRQFRDYHWAEELLWYQEKVIVPHDEDLCLWILQIHHESLAARHQRQSRTLEMVSRRYWWPGMKAEINNFVDSCKTCQRTKGLAQKLTLKPLPVAEGPWKDITYNMIVKLPMSKIGKESYDSIFTVIDRHPKMVPYYPCRESMTSEDLAKLFIDKVWRYHGLPSRTTSARGTTFNSHFTHALYAQLGIDPHLSTAYHPETNGQSERGNKWVEGYL